MPTELRVGRETGQALRIPPRLSQALQTVPRESENRETATSQDERVQSLVALANQQDSPGLAAASALRLAALFSQRQEGEQSIVWLATYARRKRDELALGGKPEGVFGLLVEASDLAHQALMCCQPERTLELAELVASMTEEAIELGVRLGSTSLSAKTADMAAILGIASTMWGPELEPELLELRDGVLAPLSRSAGAQVHQSERQYNPEELMRVLSDLQQRLPAKRVRRGRQQKRAELVAQFIETCAQLVESETVRSVDEGAERPAALNADQQVRDLIGTVERRLRTLIATKYEEALGPRWVEHIAAKHRTMYEYWLRNMQRDQAVFAGYKEHSPGILEYARLEDLADLIAAQWQLFRTLLNFGRGKGNKAFFADMIKQIAQVRNPLAHNRTVPENELLRARVLCTDLLGTLDRAKKDEDSH